MNQALKFVSTILPELLNLGSDLFDRFKGDSAAAVREIARIREDGAKFLEAEKAARDEIAKLKKK